MKKFVIAFILLLASIAQGAVVPTEDLRVGGRPYVDIRTSSTITGADAKAISYGTGLMCASTYTISSAVTVTSHIAPLPGCMLVKSGAGTLNALGGIDPVEFQIFSGWTYTTITNLLKYSPKMFGARCDNSTDDSVPLKLALEIGGMVTLPVGTCVYAPMDLRSGACSKSLSCHRFSQDSLNTILQAVSCLCASP